MATLTGHQVQDLDPYAFLFDHTSPAPLVSKRTRGRLTAATSPASYPNPCVEPDRAGGPQAAAARRPVVRQPRGYVRGMTLRPVRGNNLRPALAPTSSADAGNLLRPGTIPRRRRCAVPGRSRRMRPWVRVRSKVPSS
jgi:hypothetical protein